MLTFSILAWTYKLSTTSRFAVPSSKTGGTRASYFLAPSVGIMLAVLVFGVLGVYSNQATGNWNIALLGASISGWGFVAAIGAALAVIHTNAMNLYPSTVDLLVALNNVHKPTRWEQPLATIGLGVLGTVLAIAGILDHVQTLISDAGDIIIPFTFVMLVDWLYVQRRRTPAARVLHPPRSLADRVVPSAIVAVAIGFVLGFWGDEFLPGFFYNTLPLPVVAGLIAAILYGAGRRHLAPAAGSRPGAPSPSAAPAQARERRDDRDRKSSLAARASAWRDADPDPQTRAELDQLLASGDTAALAERFDGSLAFGTAGIRAEIGAGPDADEQAGGRPRRGRPGPLHHDQRPGRGHRGRRRRLRRPHQFRGLRHGRRPDPVPGRRQRLDAAGAAADPGAGLLRPPRARRLRPDGDRQPQPAPVQRDQGLRARRRAAAATGRRGDRRRHRRGGPAAPARGLGRGVVRVRIGGRVPSTPT